MDILFVEITTMFILTLCIDLSRVDVIPILHHMQSRSQYLLGIVVHGDWNIKHQAIFKTFYF